MSKLPGNAGESQRADPVSADTRDPIANQIDAELADHLATSSERLCAQGLNLHQAREEAQEKFGNVAAITRRCYWVQQGDNLMFRAAVIVLLLVLCVGIGAAALSGLRAQQNMAQQMAVLAEQLKAVAERQLPRESPPTVQPAEQPPLEVTGKVYIKNPKVPAAKKEVIVLSANDGKIVRRVMTDEQGQYRSGPLAAGDYSLVAGVENAVQQGPYYSYLQSAPIFVYPGVSAERLDLDVSQQVGRLAVDLSRSLPHLEVEGKYTIESRLLIRVATKQSRYEPWISSLKMPPDWPLQIMNVNATDRSGDASFRFFLELLSSDDLEQQQARTHFGDGHGLLPAGRAEVTAAIITDVIPVDYVLPVLAVQEMNANQLDFSGAVIGARKRFVENRWNMAISTAGGTGPVQHREFAWSLENDDFHWMTKGLGQIWLRQLKSSADATDKGQQPPEPYTNLQSWLTTNATADWICEAPVKTDRLTRLRIEVPDDIAERVQSLVAQTLDPAEFSKFTLGSAAPPAPEVQSEIAAGKHPLYRKAKISVLEFEPLTPPVDSKPPAS